VDLEVFHGLTLSVIIITFPLKISLKITQKVAELQKILIFASSIPRTPLLQAQFAGLFYFYTLPK
jgi:hypothetical protein